MCWWDVKLYSINQPSHSWVTPKLFKIAIEIHLIQLNYTANMCVEERQPLKTAKIGPVICDIWETVQDINEDTGRMCVAKLLTHRKSHMAAFHLCAKIGVHYGRCFALSRGIWGPITSQLLKIDPYCLRQKCSLNHALFRNIMFLSVISESTERNSALETYHHWKATIRLVQRCARISAIAELSQILKL